MLIRTRHPLDAAFEQLTQSFFTPTTSATTPVVDARWHDGALELTVDLPGTPEEAIDVQVAGRELTIAVDPSSGDTTRTWRRTIRLGNALDPEQVSARYVHGRLTVTVAPVAAAAPRSIAIETSPSPAIEASSSDEPVQDGTATSDSE